MLPLTLFLLPASYLCDLLPAQCLYLQFSPIQTKAHCEVCIFVTVRMREFNFFFFFALHLGTKKVVPTGIQFGLLIRRCEK